MKKKKKKRKKKTWIQTSNGTNGIASFAYLAPLHQMRRHNYYFKIINLIANRFLIDINYSILKK